jgi:hypothetical protein
MIAHVIAAIIGNYLTSVFVLGLIIAGIRVGRLGRPRTADVRLAAAAAHSAH